jgi:hypothetical protein
MGSFKPGDLVYHKSTNKKGVIKEKERNGDDWWIVWQDGNASFHAEVELYSEEEHREKFSPM